MLVSWMKLSCQLLLFSLSWGNIDTKGHSSTQTASATIDPLTADVRSVVFKGGKQVEEVQVLKPTMVSLECTWTGHQTHRLQNITGYWRKDGFELTDTRVPVLLENQQYNLKRVFSINDEDGLGNYSCVFDNQAEVHFILAAPQVGEVRDKPIVSYVGDSVALDCKMEDPKPKPNTWYWYRVNETGKELIDAEAEPSHYRIHNTEGKTKLTVRNLTEVDTGSYYCGAVYDIAVTMSRVDLKVITFLEPLKPFLFILVEVVILVAIILLYERGRCLQNTDNTPTDNQPNKSQEDSCGPASNSTTRQRKV